MRGDLAFLFSVWKTTLLAALEYRAAFLAQVFGMMLNNGLYFIFWILFFDRFKSVGGWALRDMFLLFGISAASYGLAVYLFGNVLTLSDIIAGGRLDYYLSLPRSVLWHALASKSVASGLGDFIYGIGSFCAAGYFTPDAFARFAIGVAFGFTVFLSFLILVHSLAFWLGDASLLGRQAVNAMLTFALYPLTLFDNSAKLILFTVIPAAFMGSVPAQFVRDASWSTLALLAVAALSLLTLALTVFARGLRRYESGSAIQTQV